MKLYTLHCVIIRKHIISVLSITGGFNKEESEFSCHSTGSNFIVISVKT